MLFMWASPNVLLPGLTRFSPPIGLTYLSAFNRFCVLLLLTNISLIMMLVWTGFVFSTEDEYLHMWTRSYLLA